MDLRDDDRHRSGNRRVGMVLLGVVLFLYAVAIVVVLTRTGN